MCSRECVVLESSMPQMSHRQQAAGNKNEDEVEIAGGQLEMGMGRGMRESWRGRGLRQ